MAQIRRAKARQQDASSNVPDETLPARHNKVDQGGVWVEDTPLLAGGRDNSTVEHGLLMVESVYTLSTNWSMIINITEPARENRDAVPDYGKRFHERNT